MPPKKRKQRSRSEEPPERKCDDSNEPLCKQMKWVAAVHAPQALWMFEQGALLPIDSSAYRLWVWALERFKDCTQVICRVRIQPAMSDRPPIHTTWALDTIGPCETDARLQFSANRENQVYCFEDEKYYDMHYIHQSLVRQCRDSDNVKVIRPYGVGAMLEQVDENNHVFPGARRMEWDIELFQELAGTGHAVLRTSDDEYKDNMGQYNMQLTVFPFDQDWLDTFADQDGETIGEDKAIELFESALYAPRFPPELIRLIVCEFCIVPHAAHKRAMRWLLSR